MVERDRDIEERRVAEMAEKLSVYKREVSADFSQSNTIERWVRTLVSECNECFIAKQRVHIFFKTGPYAMNCIA